MSNSNSNNHNPPVDLRLLLVQKQLKLNSNLGDLRKRLNLKRMFNQDLRVILNKRKRTLEIHDLRHCISYKKINNL